MFFVRVKFGSLRIEATLWKKLIQSDNFCLKVLFEKNTSARFRARVPLDPAKRSHRVYFSNVIHNSSIFHPNNFEFWEELLLTYMNNFRTGSFLYIKLLQILFVGKVKKHELRRATICY